MKRRQTILSLVVFAAAAVVIVLVAMIGLGYLVLPKSTPAPITITSTQYTILEGTKVSGAGYWFWFANSSGNYTDGTCAGQTCTLSFPGVNGYPTTEAPGTTFYVVWLMWNQDTVAHNVTSVLVGAPFTYLRTSPPPPVAIPAGNDEANFQFFITAPSDAGASVALSITIQTS
jgi:hypothetical protein